MREEGKSKKAKGKEYEENEVMEVEEGGGSRGEKTGGKKHEPTDAITKRQETIIIVS